MTPRRQSTFRNQHSEFRTQTPFDIPEVLERILSYVNKRTLTHSAILVSRQWLAAGRRSITLEYAWSDCVEDTEELKRALTMMPWMSRLQWYTGATCWSNNLVPQEEQWFLLLAALEALADKETLQRKRYDADDQNMYDNMKERLGPKFAGFPTTPQGRITEGPRTRLKAFELYGDIQTRRLRLLLPVLSSLTRLKLAPENHTSIWQLGRGDRPFHIGHILHECRHLEDLHIASTRGGFLPGPWALSAARLSSSASSSSPDTSQPSLPLRSLELEGVTFFQSHLEDLLVQTPHLKHIKILYARMERPPPESGIGSLNYKRFVQHLRGLPLRLESLHFSVLGRPRNEMTSDICPNSHVRTIWTTDLKPAMVQSLRLTPNTITTLELLEPGNAVLRYDLGSMLHKYLCSSPHLLHLRAPYSWYPIDHMDLHGLQCTEQYAGEDFRPGIWQCRNLRTLTIRIAPFDITRRTPLSSIDAKGLHSRIVCGYIARVCPELRELVFSHGNSAKVEYPSLDLSIAGGFCLLGRLRHLERLRIERWRDAGHWTQDQFEWMLPSGQTEERKAERRKELMPLWRRLGIVAAPGGKVKVIGYKKTTDPKRSFDWTDVDPALRQSLCQLGSPYEVKRFFDQLNRQIGHKNYTGFRCFPVLRYLSICGAGEVELSPEREISRLHERGKGRDWH
ncbi:hypothetical protein BGZ95_003211 [Linnemannia exigua]|uniref:F-box domain-containing protein n=1 Tax=Linnemannia exigua TaxID=604196 RepID=A0AAD4H9A6_9FUNG|nr:hypothetical protein BGZ95_003211 [Linnemannia exigua]